MTKSNMSRAVPPQVEVVIVGAGFAGLYLLHRLRKLGFEAVVLEAANEVGGTWYWNRYPGARCDLPTTDYVYSFDPALEQEWTWSEKYATQPEILAYLNFVADRYDLRSDIVFETRLLSADWNEATGHWQILTDREDRVACRFLVMATGCLSLPKTPDLEGAEDYGGSVYLTSRWPHEPVSFAGKRVAVIGTGSSGIQVIPMIAAEAEQLIVFQRTANFSFPAWNGPPPAERVVALAADRDAYRHAARWSPFGVPTKTTAVMGVSASEEVRRERFEAAWAQGDALAMMTVFADVLVDPASNEILAEMLRDKIRSVVRDPATAETLCPKDHPVGTKRPCLDTDYFETFNRANVRLIDLRRTPITRITELGIDTAEESFEFDAIVYATGFDALTGPLLAVDITGRNGLTLRTAWADGPFTYLGLTTVGFPNFFMVTGPQSPSVLSNVVLAVEQHVEWICDCLVYLREAGFETIEPTRRAQAGWLRHCDDCASLTLYPQANSWYMGANVPGKPRVFLPYIGGLNRYRAACDEVVARGYLGFRLTGPSGSQCNDGVVRRLQPDVADLLAIVADLDLPPLETLPAAEARTFVAAMAQMRPPGPEVGEIASGILPGAVCPLGYELYRPGSPGPHTLVVYLHGGGWVVGSQDSDAPLCRDLCIRLNAVVVSVDYRHAPEHPFPAAPEDALAAVRWIAANATELGGLPGPVVVAGWSAGANLAAVCCQMARDAGGPDIAAQLLLTPVTDCDLTRTSYFENGEGYTLTTSLMRWCWDQYADPSDRSDPRASPLRGVLAGLPPAVVVTAEFDPLRDEGDAYAAALADAGVPVTHIQARGHTHTSLGMVDVVLSGARVRAETARAVRPHLAGAIPVSLG